MGHSSTKVAPDFIRELGRVERDQQPKLNTVPGVKFDSRTRSGAYFVQLRNPATGHRDA